jgi:hypothetical protein
MLASKQGNRMQGEQEGASPNGLREAEMGEHSDALDTSRFGLYEEGDGVISLYLSPIHLPALLSGLGPWTRDKVVAVLGAGKLPEGAIPIQNGGYIASADAILEIEAPAEAVIFSHAPSAAELNSILPSSLLACPQGALPKSLGAQFAVVAPDAKHLILLTRDRSLLLHILEHFLNLRHAHGRVLPRIEGTACEEILASMEPWAWRRLSRSEEDGVQRMALETVDSEAGFTVTDRVSWVAPMDGGYWRSGWSW